MRNDYMDEERLDSYLPSREIFEKEKNKGNDIVARVFSRENKSHSEKNRIMEMNDSSDKQEPTPQILEKELSEVDIPEDKKLSKEVVIRPPSVINRPDSIKKLDEKSLADLLEEEDDDELVPTAPIPMNLSFPMLPKKEPLVSHASFDSIGSTSEANNATTPIVAEPYAKVSLLGKSIDDYGKTFIHKPKEENVIIGKKSAEPDLANKRANPGLEATEEVEFYVMAGFLKDSYTLALTLPEMNESYFRNVGCRIIYMALLDFFTATQMLPNEPELLIYIERKYIDLGMKLDEVKDLARELLCYPSPNEEILLNRAAELIKKVNSKRTLQRILERTRDGDALEDSQVLVAIQDALTVNIEPERVFYLHDTDNLLNIRADAVGEGEDKVIPSIFSSLNSALMYGGYQAGTLNLIVAPPSIGKTSLMVNEGMMASLLGHYVLHIFLGDMTNWDGWLRYVSCASGIAQRELARYNAEQLYEVINQQNEAKGNVLSRIGVLSFAAGEKTVREIIEEVKSEQVKKNIHFDEIIIDYADNFAREMKDNMYLEGGLVYDRLAMFARKNHSVLLIATQPKLSYWSTEIMPMEAAGESSKKQQVVDLMLCFNKPSKKANFGTINIAKMRRGNSGEYFRVKTEWEHCRIFETGEDTYREFCEENGLISATEEGEKRQKRKENKSRI